MVSHCDWLLSIFHFFNCHILIFLYLIAVLISPLKRVKWDLDWGQSCPLLPGQLINSLQIASNYHSHFCVYIFPPSQFYCSFSSYSGNYSCRRITWGYHDPNTNLGPRWHLTGLTQPITILFLLYISDGKRPVMRHSISLQHKCPVFLKLLAPPALKKKSNRTALACHAPRRSDLTSDTRVTDLASDPQNVNKWAGWILAFECL